MMDEKPAEPDENGIVAEPVGRSLAESAWPSMRGAIVDVASRQPRTPADGEWSNVPPQRR